MSKRFDGCLSFVLGQEGGLNTDPTDRGGRTNHGVTQGVYDAWRRGKGLSIQAVDLITPAEVREIFEDLYWNLLRCDDLPPPLDLFVFDTAVNMGAGFAGRCLQEALKMNVIDGIVGSKTVAAAKAANLHNLLGRFAARRLTRAIVSSEMPDQANKLAGWLHRLGDLLRRV
jgi:lysozyme family protein